MSLSTLPLSYCTNLHPGQTVFEICSGLEEHAIPARELFGKPMAAGLWIPAAAVEEIHSNRDELEKLRTILQDGELVCYTLNTFPYGNFHSERVKEQVYLPDWTSNNRLEYTASCAHILSILMPEGVEGSLSTVPLGFKQLPRNEDFLTDCIAQLLKLANRLDEIHDETGKVIRLAIEPEPLCVLETTAETIAFFATLYDAASSLGLLEVAQRHLGVCYDVCHQAVEFEDVAESIAQLTGNGIRINKVHITCALRLPSPGEQATARQQLSTFVEQRYLHQTFARTPAGTVSQLDLTKEFCADPPQDFAAADEWRIHFHVPVNREQVGELFTTRDDLRQALQAVAALEYAPHLEVETYTWGVLPGEDQPTISEGLAAELTATDELLSQLK